MTDDMGDAESEQADVSRGADTGSAIPGGSDWDLVTQVPFDGNEKHDLTSAIIFAVAEAEGTSPIEINEPPLYEILDVVALEAAFFGSSTIGQSSDGYRSVEFMFRDFRIVIRSDSWVQVYESDES